MIWGHKGILTRINKPHTHDMHELFVCLNNNGVQKINGMEMRFRKGMAFFLPGASSHWVEADTKNPSEFAFVCFDRLHFMDAGKPKIQKMLEDLDKGKHYFSGNDRKCGKNNIKLIDELINEIENPAPYAEEKASSILEILLINFYRSLEFLERKDDSEKETIDRLCSKIAAKPEKPVTLEDAARICNMSRTKFCQKFKESRGMTLIEYILCMRLKKAFELLKQPETSISSAAFESGFNNMGHFHKAFKNHFNVTPLNMKKTFKSKGLFPRVIKEQ
jgi:AraC-like DNA-binding protein